MQSSCIQHQNIYIHCGLGSDLQSRLLGERDTMLNTRFIGKEVKKHE
jgi:hypothetical protein